MKKKKEKEAKKERDLEKKISMNCEYFRDKNLLIYLIARSDLQ